MVCGLHAAGLEVILDVVYNHTAEGDAARPDVVLPGARQRRLLPARRTTAASYVDDTGMRQHARLPQPADAAADHGLAALLGAGDARRRLPFRSRRDASAAAPTTSTRTRAFLEAVGQDPVLAQVKLIAEPWDIGAGGYEVGDFPPGWSEWNGRYRDTVRDFWRGDRAARSATSRRA